MIVSTAFACLKKCPKLYLGLLIISLSLISMGLITPALAKVQIGQEAPDFTLKDQEGKEHKLSDYRGKVVVLEWTNPTCPFVEYPYQRDTMTTLASEHSKVVWLTINSSYFTTAEANKKWAKLEGVKTVLADPSGATGKIYNARTTPHMYVIDSTGKLVYQGAIDDNPHMDKRETVNYVERALKSLSRGTPIKTGQTPPYGCSVKYKR